MWLSFGGKKELKKSKCQSAVRDICRQWHISPVFKRHHQEIQATESHYALIVRRTAGAFSQTPLLQLLLLRLSILEDLPHYLKPITQKEAYKTLPQLVGTVADLLTVCSGVLSLLSLTLGTRVPSNYAYRQ